MTSTLTHIAAAVAGLRYLSRGSLLSVREDC